MADKNEGLRAQLNARCKNEYNAIITGLRAQGAVVVLMNAPESSWQRDRLPEQIIDTVNGGSVDIEFDQLTTYRYSHTLSGEITVQVRAWRSGMKSVTYRQNKDGTLNTAAIVSRILKLTAAEVSKRQAEAKAAKQTRDADEARKAVTFGYEVETKWETHHTNCITGGPDRFALRLIDLDDDQVKLLLQVAYRLGVVKSARAEVPDEA